MSGVHRRKSRKDEAEDDVGLAPSPPVDSTKRNVNGARDGHHRTRSISTPESDVPSLPQAPPSFPPGPYRPALNIPRANGLRPTHQPASSPLRASFSAPTHLAIHDHARTRSVSGPYQPSLPSPLSASFPPNHLPFSNTSASLPPSSSAPEALPRPGANANADGHSRTASFLPIAHDAPSNASNPPSNRRHARLHSRNLSVFFPRPGSLPHTTISEDGSQEIEAPTTLIPPASTSASASSPRTKLGEGFTFGSRPPPDAALGSPTLEMARTPSARRGHHHKHSLSHNFFSFLEPGSSPAPQQQAHPVPAHLHTQPTPNPAAPWTSDSHGRSVGDEHEHARRPTPPSDASPISASPSGTAPFGFERDPGRMPPEAAVAATGQFALGALLWVAGQQVGSLACTGLGYWVVFDALGVGVSRLLPAYLRRPSMQQPLRRPYGNGRLETVVLFAQAVYLMFSAVYVFKEAVEHLLLSAGEGHHHHPGDEDIELLGIEFPLALLFLAFFSLLGTALAFDNHGKLMNVSGTQLPSVGLLLDPSRSSYAASKAEQPATHAARVLANPYSLAPIALSLVLFLTPILVPATEQRAVDLLLAAAAATGMFALAYPSCVAIGTVLLQTSPQRGLSHGRMEGFLRAMREIERHPQVLHLPPPHIWQLTPTEHEPRAGGAQPLVVSLELRVARKLGDGEVLRLTRWAWERCVRSLEVGGGEGKEWITVGVVRG
ncbi:hypothetical protein OF83DRAFT_762624 [Amylostereum chailletii]|nr:hypothetical protein OF83DRAFT_762624 [Amylostereum chailletii]